MLLNAMGECTESDRAGMLEESGEICRVATGECVWGGMRRRLCGSLSTGARKTLEAWVNIDVIAKVMMKIAWMPKQPGECGLCTRRVDDQWRSDRRNSWNVPKTTGEQLTTTVEERGSRGSRIYRMNIVDR